MTYATRHQPGADHPGARSCWSTSRPKRGSTGRSYLFCYLPAAANPPMAKMLDEIALMVRGGPRSTPPRYGRSLPSASR